MDFRNLNDVLVALEDMNVVQTDEGSLVRMTDVRRLMLEKQVQEYGEAHPEEPPPRTWQQARQQAKNYLLELNGPPPITEPGRAVPAFVSPSAVEGV